MNPETLALIAELLTLGEQVYAQASQIVADVKAGKVYTVAELTSKKTDIQAAHEIVQAWRPAT